MQRVGRSMHCYRVHVHVHCTQLYGSSICPALFGCWVNVHLLVVREVCWLTASATALLCLQRNMSIMAIALGMKCTSTSQTNCGVVSEESPLFTLVEWCE